MISVLLRRALLAAPAALALACVVPIAAEVSETVEHTVSLQPGGSFSLENLNGGVAIAGWDRDEVRITAEKKAPSPAALASIEINIDADGDEVDVETEFEDGYGEGAAVNFQINVPSSAGVEVETVNGSISIDNVDGEIEIESVNGAVRASGLRGPADIETVNGAIDVIYDALPTDAHHNFEAVNGPIDVQLPADANGKFRAETVNGQIETDFGLRVEKAKFGPMRSLNGSLGTGGGKFSLETVNGAIRIRNSGAAARANVELVNSRVEYRREVRRAVR